MYRKEVLAAYQERDVVNFRPQHLKKLSTSNNANACSFCSESGRLVIQQIFNLVFVVPKTI